MSDNIDKYIYLTGRVIIGLYFLIPGISKVLSFPEYIQIVTINEVPFPAFSLILVILCQLIFGSSIILGRFLKLGSLILAINIILFNFYIHDFWNINDVINQKHEMQNFIKNIAILAGLLILYKTDERSN
ncbi:MAG: DoxX family protein [Gammaproteobacteria bacterium]|nr:DoxX family protein [Gammaproteobacteria bacterium]